MRFAPKAFLNRGLPWLAALLITAWAAALSPQPCGAYSSGCHTNATEEGANIFRFPELRDMQGTVDEGAATEDYVDHIYDYSGFTMTLCHFWDADDSDLCTVPFMGYGYENGWMKSRELLARAIGSYNAYIAGGAGSDKAQAYEYLGHVAHIVEDQALPAHAHVDYHPNSPLDDDCYEDWMANADHPEPCICPRWTAENALARWGEIIISPDTLSNVMGYLADEAWEPRPLYAKLYFLMYTSNQVADYFASDSYDGDTDDRLSDLALVTYAGMPGDAPTESGELSENDVDPDNDAGGHLTMIADNCYTYAISATAALYRAWRDYWDGYAPHTTAEVTAGHPEVHDGWRAGFVWLRLTGDDASGGAAVHDSGVYSVEWRLPGQDWDAQIGDFTLIEVNDEGILEIPYRSTDWFGNVEPFQTLTLKIDKTFPVVSVLSPTPDDIYLTDGSFTVDFEASDTPSGLYSVMADLDGTPVSDGQVFQDLEQMAGSHTLTVRAEDLAGNVWNETVTFNIYVHAAIAVDPPVINTNGTGGFVLAQVGFPPEYDAGLIDLASSYMAAGANSILAASGSVHHGNTVLKFERAAVCSALQGLNGDATLVVTGTLLDGTGYYGEDVVTVSSPGGKRAPGGSGTALKWDLAVTPSVLGTGAVAVEFSILKDNPASVRIYGVDGELVRSLFEGPAACGTHQVTWDGRDAGGRQTAAGIYYVKLQAAGTEIVRRVLRVR